MTNKSHNKSTGDTIDDDLVFRALASPARRKILDIVRGSGGISLGEIAERFEMSRFGIRKHLEILLETSLVTVEKDGRTKRHYINPIPIQTIYDRWLTKYSARWAAALTGLKYTLETEESEENPMDDLKLRYEVYIRTTADKLWDAITNGDTTRIYYYGSPVESTFKKGDPIHYKHHEDASKTMISGEILEADPGKKLVHTFDFGGGDGPSIVTYEIEEMGDVCKLTLVHEFDEVNDTYKGVQKGWNPILSGLKTWLETGERLDIPMG